MVFIISCYSNSKFSNFCCDSAATFSHFGRKNLQP